jgi:hypothetical protein
VAYFRRRCWSSGTQLGWVLVIHDRADAAAVVRGSDGNSRLASGYWTFDRTNNSCCAGSSHRSTDFRHAGVALGLACLGLPSKSGPCFHAIVRPGSCLHSSDVLEGPFTPPRGGVVGFCARRRVLHTRAAWASRPAIDRTFLEASSLDTVAAPPGLGDKVICRRANAAPSVSAKTLDQNRSGHTDVARRRRHATARRRGRKRCRGQ